MEQPHHIVSSTALSDVHAQCRSAATYEHSRNLDITRCPFLPTQAPNGAWRRDPRARRRRCIRRRPVRGLQQQQPPGQRQPARRVAARVRRLRRRWLAAGASLGASRGAIGLETLEEGPSGELADDAGGRSPTTAAAAGGSDKGLPCRSEGSPLGERRRRRSIAEDPEEAAGGGGRGFRGCGDGRRPAQGAAGH